MSIHHEELRRRLARGDDLYDTMCWFLTAVDAQACADGGPEPHLSWFEAEFLKENIELYHRERCRRMTWWELMNEMALSIKSDQPRIDVSDWSDKDLMNATIDEHYGESATEELVKRANARCMTMADYFRYVVSRDPAMTRRSGGTGGDE